MAATSTYMSFLMYKNGSNYEKLIDIKEFPDLGGDPELIETTTLSDYMQTYVPGVQSNEGMSFTANYEHDKYTTLKALENVETDFAVWFGGTESNGVATPDGSEGKFNFKGKLSVHVSGAGVNEVREMAIMIAPTSVITDAT